MKALNLGWRLAAGVHLRGSQAHGLALAPERPPGCLTAAAQPRRSPSPHGGSSSPASKPGDGRQFSTAAAGKPLLLKEERFTPDFTLQEKHS